MQGGIRRIKESPKFILVDELTRDLKFTIEEFTISLFTIYDLFTIWYFFYLVDNLRKSVNQ